MRIFRGGLIALAIFFVGAVLVWTFAGSRIVRSQLISAVEKDCPDCTFNIGKLDISLVSGHVLATDIEFIDDPKAPTVVNFKVTRVEFNLNPMAVFGRPAQVDKIDLEHPDVVVRERDSDSSGPSPAFPPPGYATRGLPPLRSDGLQIHDGHFTYELEIFKKIAKIQVRQIDGKIDSFTTRYELATEGYAHPIHLHVSGVLEQSGNVELDVNFDPFAEKNHDRIVLDLNEQKMAELDPFFSVEDGIKLEGILHHGHATMYLSEGIITGNLETIYENLGLKFHTTPDHGAIKTFLMKAVTGVRLVKTRPRDDQDMPATPILAKREPHTPIIKWILKGLKDASNKIISG